MHDFAEVFFREFFKEFFSIIRIFPFEIRVFCISNDLTKQNIFFFDKINKKSISARIFQ